MDQPEYRPSWEEIKAEMARRSLRGCISFAKGTGVLLLGFGIVALHTWFAYSVLGIQGENGENAAILGFISAGVIWVLIPVCLLSWYEDIVRGLQYKHYSANKKTHG